VKYISKEGSKYPIRLLSRFIPRLKLSLILIPMPSCPFKLTLYNS